MGRPRKTKPTPADVREALRLKRPILPYLMTKFRYRAKWEDGIEGELTIDKMLRIIHEDQELANAFNEALLIRYGKNKEQNEK